ncbi:flagellar hook assembly protein FlgD [Gracilibacillus sp. YIM 98692]|uniref:flagellar hook assembly protein FlgD n=1 Tax=Gracilibacillus sp. YIM 98692 TaxID=2663532 RepID=UPI0013D8ACBE|nr:flagellar hook assembly protein FlgD [Gracilibacillus sp. YIM 98692]
MTSIDPSLYLTHQTRTEKFDDTLGKEDFLKILMAQLQNQDPLNPMEDKEFISQMATFSSLEQMTNMSSGINQLVQHQSLAPVVQYSHLIGKEVSYYQLDEETGEIVQPRELVSSKVEAVSQNDGEAIIELANNQSVSSQAIIKVE